MRALLIAVLVVVGLMAGFGGGLAIYSTVENQLKVIDLTASLKAQTGWIGQLGQGWGAITTRGTQLAGQVATLTIPMPYPAHGDLLLEINGASSPNAKRRQGEVDVLANEQKLGTWRLSTNLGKRLLLTAAVASSRDRLVLSFVPKGLDEPLVLESVTVRDVGLLKDFEGYLDSCQGGAIAGWAKSGFAPAPIIVRRNGKPVLAFVPSTERPDLVAGGHPLDSGFNVVLTPPVVPGEKIDVVFPNGRPLGGTACR